MMIPISKTKRITAQFLIACAPMRKSALNSFTNSSFILCIVLGCQLLVFSFQLLVVSYSFFTFHSSFFTLHHIPKLIRLATLFTFHSSFFTLHSSLKTFFTRSAILSLALRARLLRANSSAVGRMGLPTLRKGTCIFP